MTCETLALRVEQSLLQNLAGQWAEEELWGHLTIRGDEGSLKGVEQKVHATELVVRSYISLRIMEFFNTSNSVSPRKHGAWVARDEGSPLWGKSKGVLSPDDCTFRNVRRGDQTFPLLLVEILHPEGETFLCILERIEAVKKLAGRGFKSSGGIGGRIFGCIDQTKALENFPRPLFTYEPSRVLRQQQHVKFRDTQSRVLPAQRSEDGGEVGIRR